MCFRVIEVNVVFENFWFSIGDYKISEEYIMERLFFLVYISNGRF